MTVLDIKKEIESFKASGVLSQQTVEMIIGTKKYFLSDFSCSGDTLSLIVTRQHFKKTTNAELLDILHSAHDSANVVITESPDKEGKTISQVFCGRDYIEFLAE